MISVTRCRQYGFDNPVFFNIANSARLDIPRSRLTFEIVFWGTGDSITLTASWAETETFQVLVVEVVNFEVERS